MMDSDAGKEELRGRLGESGGLRWNPLHINRLCIDEMIRRGLGLQSWWTLKRWPHREGHESVVVFLCVCVCARARVHACAHPVHAGICVSYKPFPISSHSAMPPLLWEPFPGHSGAKGHQLGHECQSSQICVPLTQSGSLCVIPLNCFWLNCIFFKCFKALGRFPGI